MKTDANRAPKAHGDTPARPYRHFLEVTAGPGRVYHLSWSEDRHGAPSLENLREMVDGHNLNRDREEFGRRPWWCARIVDRETGNEIVYYKPKMDGIGRRVKL